jgi:hypothetical protein
METERTKKNRRGEPAVFWVFGELALRALASPAAGQGREPKVGKEKSRGAHGRRM